MEVGRTEEGRTEEGRTAEAPTEVRTTAVRGTLVTCPATTQAYSMPLINSTEQNIDRIKTIIKFEKVII